MPTLSLFEWILIIFSLLSASLFMVFGLRWKSAFIWRLIDLLYYPIGILGVILLFVSNDSSRATVELQGEIVRRSARVAELDRLKPHNQPGDLSIAMLHSSYDLAMSEASLAEACKSSLTVSIQCLASSNIGPAIKNNLKISSWPSNEDGKGVLQAFEQYCNSLQPLVIELRKSGDNTLIIDKFVELYNEAAAKDFKWFEFDSTKQYRDKFLDSFMVVKKLYGDTQIGDGILMLDLFNEELKDFGNIFYAFEVCLRVPSKVREGATLKFERQLTDANHALTEKVQELRNQLRFNEQRLHWAAFAANFWPYVIVFALALKCGKATAGLTAADLDQLADQRSRLQRRIGELFSRAGRVARTRFSRKTRGQTDEASTDNS